MKTTLLSIATALLVGTAFAQAPFTPLNDNLYDSIAHPNDPDVVIIPASPLKYDVLFIGGVDSVYNKDNNWALAKEWHDFTGYVPIDGRSDSGYVVINHERINRDATNGDGGGMTVFTVWFNATTSKWQVVPYTGNQKFRNVDFSGVGGTAANCGGIQTSWGKVFTAEEWGIFFSNDAINDPVGNGLGFGVDPGNPGGFSDTSDYTIVTFNGTTVNQTIKRHENYQFMVEVDVATATAVRKNYNMGRYDHEGGWIASDRKTVYLSDDKSSGSVLFRFVADVAEDFSKGQLYAYKQSTDGLSGTWVPLTMDLTTMMNARDSALALGATVFMRLEWVEGINDNTVFITETGRGGTVNVSSALSKGGHLAKHLADLDAGDGTTDSSFTDTYGRILRLNTANGRIEVALEGGGQLNGDGIPVNNHLSSPDGLVSTVIDGKTYLVINEDMNPSGPPANPVHFGSKLNEVYFLDVTSDAMGTTYNEHNLRRFMVGPAGCETTGGRFTPDGSTYFVNIQHPSSSNTYPFNHSVTIAVTGFNGSFTSIDDIEVGDGFNIYPNPASRELYLNDVMDIAIYNMEGKRVMVQRNVNIVDISALTPGMYFIQNTHGEIKKLIVQ